MTFKKQGVVIRLKWDPGVGGMKTNWGSRVGNDGEEGSATKTTNQAEWGSGADATKKGSSLPSSQTNAS